MADDIGPGSRVLCIKGPCFATMMPGAPPPDYDVPMIGEVYTVSAMEEVYLACVGMVLQVEEIRNAPSLEDHWYCAECFRPVDDNGLTAGTRAFFDDLVRQRTRDKERV